MSNKKHYKYACVYTDGGMRTMNNVPGAGAGIHGYFFNELESMRYAKVSELVTVRGYQPKPTGAQLKSDNYNPKFENWGIKQEFRTEDENKPCKTLTEADVVIVDGWQGIKEQPTNNRGEMQAIINLFNECPITADNYLVMADSMLVVNGIKRDISVWKSRGWAKSDGTEVKNLDLWKQIDEIVQRLGDKLQIEYIKAHSGFYGNECSDRNATHGVCCAINNDCDVRWKVTSLCDGDYWAPEKPIPPIMRVKWCYGLTGEPRRTYKVGDTEYLQYFCGDHSKDKDDTLLLGKEISDAGFCVILNKSKVEPIDNMFKYHELNMWDHKHVMYQSDVVAMVNISNVNSPKELWRMNNVNKEALIFKSHRSDVVSHDENLLSCLIRPPKLSYRVLDIRTELTTALISALKKLDIETKAEDLALFKNIELTDVTDKFYTREVKKDGKEGACKLSDFYDQITKSVKLDIKQPCNDELVDVIFTSGIDMPIRNIMSAIAPENPKVYTVAWKFSKQSFKYGMMIITDKSMSFWEGYYSSRRDFEMKK